MTKSRTRGRPRHDDILTPAEWRIVHATQHGLTNREIARRCNISVDAVKFHVANITSKLDLSNKKAIREWFRIPKTAALNQTEPNMEALSLGPIGQISRTVSDIKVAEDWYSNTLGLTHLYTFGTLAFFDCAGTRLFLSEDENGAGTESVIYLSVPDIQMAKLELANRGIEFVSEPHLIHTHEDGTEEWMAFFNDPDGRPLGIMSQVQPLGSKNE
ncbi:MAG: LuxR C-terminal-related transcriptional regulator [Pseudomonadota bacterium]